MNREDEFFVGYLPMPPALACRLRKVLLLAAGVVAGVAIAIAVAQRGFAHSVFEFGEYRTFEGILLERPYPLLLLPRPGASDRVTSYSAYVLVDKFKRGADETVRGLNGKRVRLKAQLIYRDNTTMLELKPGTLKAVNSEGAADGQMQSLGPVTVTGELVDSKCYLGVMNPGQGKVHRDCATQCARGGVPVAMVSTDPKQRGTVYFVQSTTGRLPREVLAHMGETTRLSGESFRIGEQTFLLIRYAK
jgi:hypothetical protein